MIEVLATVLSSPQALYVTRSQPKSAEGEIAAHELATRLSMFLWCSIPDSRLMRLADSGALLERATLAEEAERMLRDPRARRFEERFVHQWLGLQLLEYLKVDRKSHPHFDPALKEAMLQEPVAFFREVLANDHSVLDFLHADYVMVNERLARHCGIAGVQGNHFRRVALSAGHQRGGVLTLAGTLAMNSDGEHSHPLKRGIWMLERLLHDPPPPPPPAVPEIDVADPKIAQMTLKQRLEDHRNQAACASCHSKIDPWGIALENFDATGRWRDQLDGRPVDASSVLFNQQELKGIDGLKRYLLASRQDQFVRAMVHKLATFGLGRTLTFGDHSSIDRITGEVRRKGDGLGTMVTAIVTSNLFRRK